MWRKSHFKFFLFFLGFAGQSLGADGVRVGEIFRFPILGNKSAEIRPSQQAVGYEAVEAKRIKLSKMESGKLEATLQKETIPVVKGPDGNFYVIDHHHFSLAAHEAGVREAYFQIAEDFSKLKSMESFWREMDIKKWVRTFDYEGKPMKIPQDLPVSLLKMRDDPYRSLAWFVRKADGYEKSGIEFAEFQWADFFRTRIPRWTDESERFAATEEGVRLARSDSAKNLPGWNPKGPGCSGFFGRVGD